MIPALNPALAYAAGALTILSPCVLPLLPIVLSSAAQRHRFAPLALTGGLVVAFTVTGFFVAVFGQALGIDTFVVREAGAIAICVASVFLVVPALGERLGRHASQLIGWASRRQEMLDSKAGLCGQAVVGALLGVVWAPCVGPTLGAAIVLATEGKNLGEAALVMVAFGLGISTVMVFVALLARGAFAHYCRRLIMAGSAGKVVLGVLLFTIGLSILTGFDRKVEAFSLDRLPERVTEWSTMI